MKGRREKVDAQVGVSVRDSCVVSVLVESEAVEIQDQSRRHTGRLGAPR